MKINFAYDQPVIPGCSDLSNKEPQRYYFLKNLNCTISINGNIQNNIYKTGIPFVAIEDAIYRCGDINLLTMGEAIDKQEKFIYWIVLASNHGITAPSFNSINSNNVLISFLQPLVDSINKGMCMFCMEDTQWSTNEKTKKSFFAVIYLLLRSVGITNFNNVYVITSTHNHTTIPIKTLFWEYFERAIIDNYKKTDYTLKIHNAQNNLQFKRFLFLNHVPRLHRVYIFYKIFTTISQFSKYFAASFCPDASLDYYIKEFYEKYNKPWVSDFCTNLKKLLPDSTLPDWFLSSKTDDNFLEQLSSVFNKTPITFATELAPWKKSNFKKGHPRKSWFINFDDEQGGQWTLFAKAWENTGICVVVETDFISYRKNNSYSLSLTEKIFKPIAMKSPFIVFGQPFILKKLKEYGYKTFDSLWDESYDEIVDSVQRFDKICHILAFLCSLTDKEFITLLEKANDIVTYNYEHMKNNRFPENEIITAIKNFYNT